MSGYVRALGMLTWELRAPGDIDPTTDRRQTRIRTFTALDRRIAHAALVEWQWLVIAEGRGDDHLVAIAEAVLDELEAPGLAAELDRIVARLAASARREREIRLRRERVRSEMATRHLRARLHRALTALRDTRSGGDGA